MELTEQEKKDIIEAVTERLSKSFETGKLQRGGPGMYKVILWMLDMYNQKSFYGTLAVSVAGPDVKRTETLNRTYKVDTMFNESGASLIRLVTKKS